LSGTGETAEPVDKVLAALPAEHHVLLHELLAHIEEGFTEMSLMLGFHRLFGLKKKVAAKL
jgi:hypothetical protein